MFYYTAPPFQSSNSTPDEDRRKENYDRFTAALSRDKLITLRAGRCQKIKNQRTVKYKQKSVDTLLTMDLMSVPIKNPNIKTILLIACDSDFVPVIETLNQLSIKTILLTYFDRDRESNFSSSNELMQTVSQCTKITKKDFEDAIKT